MRAAILRDGRFFALNWGFRSFGIEAIIEPVMHFLPQTVTPRDSMPARPRCLREWLPANARPNLFGSD